MARGRGDRYAYQSGRAAMLAEREKNGASDRRQRTSLAEIRDTSVAQVAAQDMDRLPQALGNIRGTPSSSTAWPAGWSTRKPGKSALKLPAE